MSNRGEHMLGSAVAGLLTYAFVKQKMTGEQISTEEAISVTLLSGAVGTLPDELEPATNPKHRRFFHSGTSLVTLALTGEKIMQNPKYTPQQKALFAACAIAYGMHLADDSNTPAGLPII